jgi:serine/threonine-protein kinase RsbW
MAAATWPVIACGNDRPEPERLTPARRPVPRGHGHLVQVFSGDEEVRLADAVAEAMAAAGFPDRDVFGMRLALAEALANAIRHGHGGDRTKPVRVRYRVGPACVLVVVQDEGPGFDPAQIPDPRADENLNRPGGRGLLLMRRYATRVRFRGRGNVVILRTRPSTPSGAVRESTAG